MILILCRRGYSLIVGKGCAVLKSPEASDKTLGSGHLITGNKGIVYSGTTNLLCLFECDVSSHSNSQQILWKCFHEMRNVCTHIHMYTCTHIYAQTTLPAKYTLKPLTIECGTDASVGYPICNERAATFVTPYKVKVKKNRILFH